jgi:flagellar motor component MotA
MEKSTPIGIVAGTRTGLRRRVPGDGWQTFFDVGAMVLVMGGTVAALLITFNLSEVKVVPAGMKDFFAFRAPDLRGM